MLQASQCIREWESELGLWAHLCLQLFQICRLSRPISFSVVLSLTLFSFRCFVCIIWKKRVKAILFNWVFILTNDDCWKSTVSWTWQFVARDAMVWHDCMRAELLVSINRGFCFLFKNYWGIFVCVPWGSAVGWDLSFGAERGQCSICEIIVGFGAYTWWVQLYISRLQYTHPWIVFMQTYLPAVMNLGWTSGVEWCWNQASIIREIY